MPEWIYGRHAVEEALKAGRRKVFRVLRAETPKQPKLPGASREAGGKPSPDETVAAMSLARQKGITIERVPPAQLDMLTRVGHHHQGIAAEVSPFPYIGLSDTVSLCKEAGDTALVLVLDSLQDPQNFGTLLRTSESAGVTAIVMLDRRQVAVTPAVSNASAGAVEHMNVCLANNLARAIDELRDAGLWVYALQSERDASQYTSVDLRGPLGLVVGSEGRGVGHLVRQHCDGALEIPMHGKIESLNAAVAGSIVLYEALRQRGARSKP